MGLQFLRQLHPLKSYSVQSLLAYLPNKCPQKLVDTVRGKLVQLIHREKFPPLGDRTIDGQITWFGFRFIATTGVVERLPIYSRTIFAQELLIPYPFLSSKIAHFMNYPIPPQDIHPFIIALHIWEPLQNRKKKRRKYMPPPSTFKIKGGIMGSQKGVGIKWR